MRCRAALVLALATAAASCRSAPRADDYLGLPRNAEEIVLAHARTFADSARGPLFGVPGVTDHDMVVERRLRSRRRAASALRVPLAEGVPADFVLVRLGRAGYMAYWRDGFGHAGEFFCSYALLDRRLANPTRLCG